MLTTHGSPLVSGLSPDNAMANPIKTTRVKVLRPFLLKTKRQEVDAVLELDHRLAVELAGLNKVALLKPEPVAAPSLAAKAIEEPVKGKAKKES